jgi:hypothetical protein
MPTLNATGVVNLLLRGVHPTRAGLRRPRHRGPGYVFGIFIGAVAGLLLMPANGGALAFVPGDHPSFKLKVFGYDAVIFYKPQVGFNGLSTSIYIDHRQILDVAPSAVDDIQRRSDKAEEIELAFNPESADDHIVDLLATIPAKKPFSVGIDINLQRSPVVGEIGNIRLLSAVKKLSDDSDRSHFDEHGFRVLDQPVVNFIMQRKLYSRPDGRPLFLYRRTVSSRDGIYMLTGAFLVGQHARVLYTFTTDKVSEKHWADVDRAVLQIVSAILQLATNCPGSVCDNLG